jgi:glutaminyl-peptide cyclotransferase
MNRSWFGLGSSIFILTILVALLASCQRQLDSAQKKELFAEDRPSPVSAAPFDGNRAIKYLRTICDIGPRVSDTDNMRKQQKLLQEHFEKLGAEVRLQKFTGTQPSRKGKFDLTNMIIRWPSESKRRVILAGHYDTRPIADQEPRRKDWDRTFLSANDGTSTVAFFMELAHHMKELNLKVGIDFVLFDAEEYIFEPGRDQFFLGSEYFAKEYASTKNEFKYTAGILLDLFAGKNAQFPVEQNSHLFAGDVAESIWKQAKELGVNEFIWEQGYRLEDDHLALNRVGIPTVDIIDFDYKHWHRLSDTPEQCSPDKMISVSKVITVWLQKQR